MIMLQEAIEMSVKTEMQKMLDLEPYYGGDEEIAEAMRTAMLKTQQINEIKEDEREKRIELLQNLLGTCDNDIFIKPPFYCDFGFNIHVGKKFFANFQCIFLDEAPIRIGDNCLMGPNTCLYTVTHPIEPELRGDANIVYAKPITIGDNVWFGGNCVVLPGVTIGNHVVVGAGSVVTKDIPDYAVVAGNPAKIIRYANEREKML